MLRILHAADLHLDAPFAALTAQQARQRRAEQRLVLDALADAAIEGGADLVLLAGDLLDDHQTYRETAQALSAALGRIDAPVVIAPGNHDYYSPASLYAGDFWPPNVHIFREAAVGALELPGCTVYGAAFTGPFKDASPLAGFHAPAGEAPAVMVVHGEVGPSPSRYGPIRREEIAQSGLAYLALGHVHTFAGLQRSGGTYWAYPGCAEGRGFDETGDKGALWVTVDGGEVTARLLPLAHRRYEVLSCDLTGKDPAQALREALSAGRAEDICRVLLTGEAQAVDLPALRQAGEGLRWALTLRDHTRVPRDLWAREGEESLTGLFLREMRRRLDAAGGQEERATLERAVRFGLAALENGEDTP